MTTRIKGLVVTLAADIREDDLEQTVKAIGQLRNVAAVEPVPADIGDSIVRARVLLAVERRLFEVLHECRKT